MDQKVFEAKSIINNELSSIWAFNKNGILPEKQVVDIIGQVRVAYFKSIAKEEEAVSKIVSLL